MAACTTSTSEKVQPWKSYAQNAPYNNAKKEGFWYPERKGRPLTLIRGEALPNFRKI